MASINTGRVVAGGLVAGVVANILDMTWNFTVLKDDMMTVAQKAGMDPQTAASFSAALPWIGVDLVMGLIIVWTYAAMRPRFGPGPKTALLAGLVPFLSASAVVFGFTTMGIMPMAAFVRGTIAAAVTMAAASLAGAYVYSEPQERAATRAA